MGWVGVLKEGAPLESYHTLANTLPRPGGLRDIVGLATAVNGAVGLDVGALHESQALNHIVGCWRQVQADLEVALVVGSQGRRVRQDQGQRTVLAKVEQHVHRNVL